MSNTAVSCKRLSRVPKRILADRIFRPDDSPISRSTGGLITAGVTIRLDGLDSALVSAQDTNWHQGGLLERRTFTVGMPERAMVVEGVDRGYQ